MRGERDYRLLLAGQFLGAFGDNFILAAILAPLTYELARGAVTLQAVGSENILFSAVFFAAFILPAPLAGFLNDRMPKTSWLWGGNAVKLAGTAACWAGAAGGSAAQAHAWQLAGYAVVGLGACLYSPAKYGILPEILPAGRLVRANGAVEMLTLVAIVAGLGGGAALYDATRSLPGCYLACAGCYGAALVFNAAMGRTPSDPSARLSRSLAEFGRGIAGYARHPRLGRILFGSGLFWFAGAALRTNLQGWGLQVFRAAGVAEITNTKLVLLKMGLVAGVVLGSVLAGRLHRTGELGWSRRYALLMAGGILALGWAGGPFGPAWAVLALAAAGVFGGLMLVPLNAALQDESDRRRLGKAIATQNVVDYGSMLAATGFLGAIGRFHLEPTGVFKALACAVALLAAGLRLGPKPQA